MSDTLEATRVMIQNMGGMCKHNCIRSVGNQVLASHLETNAVTVEKNNGIALVVETSKRFNKQRKRKQKSFHIGTFIFSMNCASRW